MRMEANEENAPLPCADGSERFMRANPPQLEDERECHDCGNHLLSCRCSPGEG